MTATKSIHLDGRKYDLNEGESVLDALDRNNIPMLYSCRSGVCQSCLLKALEGPIPSKAQQGLKESLRAQNYFLSCVCVPEEDMTIALPGAGLDFHATVLESDDLGAAVRRIRLSIPDGFQWFPGQFVTIIRDDGTARSYSIASGPDDGFLELHIRRIPNGKLSNWFHDNVSPGTSIKFRGPYGDCFYTASEPDVPILLAGAGTGLAPLYGIVVEALRQNHKGPISLYHGALGETGLYYRDELVSLMKDGKIEYCPCVLKGNGNAGTGIISGSLDEVVLAQNIDLKTTKAYLCGDPALVEKMRKKLFLKGLSNRRIFVDAFV